jgi:valyl-tRNA synthetase
VIVPVVERHVPVIADERVEPGFGTGALKVTPGHDPVDFEIGRGHGLPEPMVIGLDGLMNAEVAEYAGLTQEEAGRRIVTWLGERGQLEKVEPYRHAVGHCERCASRVEPLISEQWFCDMSELAAPAIAAIRDGRVRFTPPVHGGVALGWLEAIRPWNVSRQLWWGHQIPVWYPSCGVTRTSWTRGSRRRFGPSRLSAGRTRPPTSKPSTRGTSTRRRARSSSSGSTG